MFITGGFVKGMIEKYPNFFEGHHFIIQLRCLSNERLIGKLSKMIDGKITFKDLYKIENTTSYIHFGDEYTVDLEDVHIFNPTSTIIYGFLPLKTKKPKKKIVKIL